MVQATLNDAQQSLLDAVRAGNTRAIARTISQAEINDDANRPLFHALWQHCGRAHIVGLTGVPGSGKSTMVTALTKELRARNKRVGIIAIDPSSPFSGGAIMGDRVRMGDLTGDEGIFIRSMATRGNLGGLTAGCMEAVDVLDAAGFDIVLIETVGVGQDEVDIARSALSVVVVSAPGLGDDIQAIKAGVLEIADIHVVSKADKPDATHTIADLKAMLGMGRTTDSRHGREGQNGQGAQDRYTVPVLSTSALTGAGITALADAIERHRDYLQSSGTLMQRYRDMARMRTIKAAEDYARRHIARIGDEALDAVLTDIVHHRMDPVEAALLLMTKNR